MAKSKPKRKKPLAPGWKYSRSGKIVKDRRANRVRKRQRASKRGKRPYKPGKRGYNPRQKRDLRGRWSK